MTIKSLLNITPCMVKFCYLF